MIELEKLFKAGVHFGHQKRRWCPKMEPYIWGYKNKVHLIDISKTAQQLERSALFLKDLASQGKAILWVGTKKPAQEIIKAVATKLDMPYVSHRWIGGTLSNFAQVKKSVTKYLHYKDILQKADKYPHYTKKELNTIHKAAARLEQNIGGIVHLSWPLGAIVVVDVIKERSAIREAVTMGVPVVALVDTNADPSLVDYVIPTNDDSPRAIKVLIDYLADATDEGKKAAEKYKQEQKLKKEEARLEAQAEQKEKKTAKDEVEEVKKAEEKVSVAKKTPKKEDAEKKDVAPKKAVNEKEPVVVAKKEIKKAATTKKAKK